MSARRRSHGSPEASASASAWSKSATAIATLASLYRQTPSRKICRPGRRRRTVGLLRARARPGEGRPLRGCLPSCTSAQASPESALTSSSAEPVAPMSRRAVAKSSAASGYRCDSVSASARASCASILPRTSVETPPPRNAASTSRRTASQAIASSVGRVLPRSIWLTYSFENLSPRPVPGSVRLRGGASGGDRRGAMSERTASLLRVRRRRDANSSSCAGRSGAASIWVSVNAIHHFSASPRRVSHRSRTRQFPSCRRISSSEEQTIANHLTELLDFFEQSLYSPHYQAPQSTPGCGARGTPNRTVAARRSLVPGPQSHELQLSQRGGEPQRQRKRPGSRSQGRFCFSSLPGAGP